MKLRVRVNFIFYVLSLICITILLYIYHTNACCSKKVKKIIDVLTILSDNAFNFLSSCTIRYIIYFCVTKNKMNEKLYKSYLVCLVCTGKYLLSGFSHRARGLLLALYENLSQIFSRAN